MLFTSYTFAFTIHTTTHTRSYAISDEIDFEAFFSIYLLAARSPVRPSVLALALTVSPFFSFFFLVARFIPCDHLFSISLASHLSIFSWVVVVVPFNYLFV